VKYKDISPLRHGEHRGEPLNIFIVGSSDNKIVLLCEFCVSSEAGGEYLYWVR